MKKLILISILLITIFSCTKEEENDITQTNSFIGYWNCHDNESENGVYAERNYLVEISLNDSNYTISNYASLGIDYSAYYNINSANFNVELQEVNGFQTYGMGTFSSDNKTAVFSYYLDDEKITSEWVKD
jgi:hypothetical protein